MDCTYENAAAVKGFRAICGVDEAGRGPLAGPVYAAAVILPPDASIEGLNDSKKLSEKKRDELFDIIMETAVACSIASVSAREIDEMNILQATFLAMKKAVEGLEVKADFALIDGNRLPPLEIEAQTIVKGDSKSPSIAAASILAKVSRDRYMYALDEEMPEYQFAKHKGYGTKLHYDMIAKYGISDAHRLTFLKNLSDHIGKDR